MPKYHINPETGNPGQCKAKGDNCPYGGAESHYPSAANARRAYELSMGPATVEAARRSAEEKAQQQADATPSSSRDRFFNIHRPEVVDFTALEYYPTEEDLAKALRETAYE